MKSKTKLFFCFLFSLFWTMQCCSAQVQHWDYSQRERSQALHSQAMTQLNKGTFKKAEVLLRQATAADASDPLPFATLGLVLAIEGEYDQALACLNKSYELGHNTETLLSTGLTYFLNRDYEAAINSWGKLISDNPRLTNVLVNLGYGYLRKGDFTKANDCFKQGIRAYPSSQIIYQGLAELDYLGGYFKQAKEACERAQVILPYAPVALLEANVDYLQGNSTRAQKLANDYQRLLRKKIVGRSMTAMGYMPQHDFHYDPYLLERFDDSNLLLARMQDISKNVNRAKSYARRGKAQAKEAKLKQLIEKFPDDFFLVHELGLVQLANAEFTDASESFKKVISLCPDCKVDLLNLAKSLYYDGKGAEAAQYIRKFQQDRPNEELLPLLKTIGLTDPHLDDPSIKDIQTIHPEAAPGENKGESAGF